MQPNEERLIERMWIEFSLGKTVNNSVCSDFFFTMIRPDRNLSHLNAFEVLDTIVNCELPPGHAKKRQPRYPVRPTNTPVSTPVAQEPSRMVDEVPAGASERAPRETT